MNKSDSERIATVLENMGYRQTLNEGEADLIVVNMCSVRQSAVDRVYGLIPKFKKIKTLPAGRQVKTILTGCILKKDKKKFKKGFDLILNIRDLPSWPLMLKNYPAGAPNQGLNYLEIRPKYQNDFS
ncbi:MAG: tRNA (N6-isopentenyl adenosine(37)-C2)-methylthiotransferase MiaB, partial [Candidatus Nealsonbacteria bacterium CG18_big_fil_WC_8_21_14_2_50_37_10]